jgi:hypothetical protein
MDLEIAQAFGDRKLRKQTTKCFHVARVFAILIPLVGVVMPAMDERYEQDWLL